MKITQLQVIRCQLGEGPVWDESERALYCVDVVGQTLWRYDPRSKESHRWNFETTISALALCQSGGCLVALKTGLHHFDFSSGYLDFIGNPVLDSDMFLNDGKADACGRFIIGGVDTRPGRGAAPLNSLDTSGRIRELDIGYAIFNGPCWSPDSRTFYSADSAKRIVFAYDYDLPTGTATNRRIFVDTAPFPGIPDGATVDSRGRLWTAMCDGAKVLCFNSDGSLAESIDFPTGFVSSVMFGGDDLERLFVTTIDANALLAHVPAAAASKHRPDDIGGSLFVIDGLDATGLPEHRSAFFRAER